MVGARCRDAPERPMQRWGPWSRRWAVLAPRSSPSPASIPPRPHSAAGKATHSTLGQASGHFGAKCAVGGAEATR